MDEDERAITGGLNFEYGRVSLNLRFLTLRRQVCAECSTSIVTVVGLNQSLQLLVDEILLPDCDFEIEYCRQLSIIEVRRKLILRDGARRERVLDD